MPALIKRGKTWFTNFRVHRFTADGEVLRKPNGKVAYDLIRWAMDTDREIAEDLQRPLLKIRREAARKGVSFLQLYESEKGARAGGHAYATWRNAYLAKRKAENKPATFNLDASAFREFEKAAAALTPAVRINSLSDITPRLLDRIKTHWILQKRGAAAINRALRAIKQGMREAAGFGDMASHDWRVVRRAPGENQNRTFYFTRKQVKRQIRRMTGPYRAMAYLGNRNGRRISEVYYLTWSGVDFKRNEIRNDAIAGVWAPKSKKSYEPVPMGKDLRDYLWNLKKSATDEFVIPRKGLTDVRSFGVMFRRQLRKMGIKQGTPHSCRHTFASHLVEAGADIYAVSKLMRHSSIKQTERYTHGQVDLQRAIRKLPRI